MKRLLLVLTPVAMALLAASCSSDNTQPSNGVPSPAGGSAGLGAQGGSLIGGAGGTLGTSGSGVGGAAGGSANAGTTSVGVAGEAGETGEAGATSVDNGTCGALPGTVVYIQSGDTQENLLKALGRQLRDTANITLVFSLTGSCTLTPNMYTGVKIAPNTVMDYIPSTAENAAWTPAMAESTCTTGSAGTTIDLGISALFAQSCGLGGPPAGSNLTLVQGPIQAYTFVVPTASNQTAIWSDEAYYTFGFGDANPLAPTYDPWNNHLHMFIRPATKSTLVATAKNIGLDPASWKGVPEAASSDVVTATATSAAADAIGILGAEVYDGNRNAGIYTLAFQAIGQKAAFYPDSSSSAFDKQNVRDGHYTLWSPTVYITPVDGSNQPTNPAVKYLEDLVLGTAGATPPGGGSAIDGLADVVQVGLIPECAMEVTRSEDGGDLSPATPAAPCTCYYLSKIPGANGSAPTGCTACTDSTTCGGGACNHGFCEPDTVSTTGTNPAGCVSTTPATNADLINACTNAQAITKNVVLPNPKQLPP